MLVELHLITRFQVELADTTFGALPINTFQADMLLSGLHGRTKKELVG